MAWTNSDGIDVTSAFQGITTPLRELYDEIHGRGWDVQKVDINGDGLYEATVKNPYGETLAKVGPDPNTAVGHCLVGIMRQETMRYPRTAAWTATWEHERPEIAQAYADAPVYDPKAAGAWKELGEDSQRRAEAIANQIRVDFTHDPYPYKDVNEMAEDIRNKQHVTISKANLAHPLWSSDQALAYRTVHDVLGHASVGGDWGWHGENGATSAHMPLLSPNAQKALFTEAIGQAAHNSYFRQMAPQKVVFLDDYLTKVQERENAAGQSGQHPSQSIVPSGIPSIEDKTSKIRTGIWDPFAEDANGNPLQDPYMYHVAPREARASIEKNGIKASDPRRGQWGHEELVGEQKPGAYLFHDRDHANYWAYENMEPDSYDVWAIDPAGLQLHEDPKMSLPSSYAQGNIPAHQIFRERTPDEMDAEDGHGPRIASISQLDPNDGWASGIEPLPDNVYLWQKEQSGLDPLDHFGLRDQAYKLDRGWFGLQDHEGVPDLESHRQAVANAFRSTLLEPRQTPRWAATHYQHIQHVPAGVSDPLRFSDALESQRDAHNQARGLPAGIARAEMDEGSEALRNWIKGLNPKMDDTQVEELARRELFHMIAEEEAQVTAEDPGGKLLPMQITDAVNKALKRRLAVMTKPSVDQKFDFGKDRLFHQGFNAPDPGVYGDFLNSHVRPIAGVGLHIDDLTRAAREDVSQHGGKGHHFRAQASDLIPGVGPKEISHAWYKLQPHTSELGVIGPSVAEGLGYDRAKEITPRDYFKMERQLAAGRDASGYGHVPLGQFSSGMHDQINYGHGVHRDLSPTAVLSPTPYDQVDWTQYPNLPTQDWNDPYWWQSSEPNRNQVGKDWDQIVATQYPAESIPYREAKISSFNPRLPSIPYITHPQSGEVIEGDPHLSLMQHAKNTLGMSTEDIWAADPEVGRRYGEEGAGRSPVSSSG